jgi:hypothetical protein
MTTHANQREDLVHDAIPPPIWPPTAASLLVAEGVYELTTVPLTSIILVTEKTIKVALIFAHIRAYWNVPF